MTTPAKKSCAFCSTPAHHTSVLHFWVHKMQLEALWGNRAFLKSATTGGIVGELGRTWKSCRSLCGSVGSCGEPKESYGNCWRLVGLARNQKKMHGRVMYRRPILRLCCFLTGVFLWLLTGIKWPQIGLLEGHKTCLPSTSNQFVAIPMS